MMIIIFLVVSNDRGKGSFKFFVGCLVVITPRACARGKVIGCVIVVVVVVLHKKSPDLGI